MKKIVSTLLIFGLAANVALAGEEGSNTVRNEGLYFTVGVSASSGKQTAESGLRIKSGYATPAEPLGRDGLSHDALFPGMGGGVVPWLGGGLDGRTMLQELNTHGITVVDLNFATVGGGGMNPGDITGLTLDTTVADYDNVQSSGLTLGVGWTEYLGNRMTVGLELDINCGKSNSRTRKPEFYGFNQNDMPNLELTTGGLEMDVGIKVGYRVTDTVGMLGLLGARAKRNGYRLGAVENKSRKFIPYFGFGVTADIKKGVSLTLDMKFQKGTRKQSSYNNTAAATVHYAADGTGGKWIEQVSNADVGTLYGGEGSRKYHNRSIGVRIEIYPCLL
ncbi:MAG: hypothetical protein LBJ16_00010 [Holosporaceae bacterium]|nr:hypothetical protein [Holosporaceae bacterium]